MSGAEHENGADVDEELAGEEIGERTEEPLEELAAAAGGDGSDEDDGDPEDDDLDDESDGDDDEDDDEDFEDDDSDDDASDEEESDLADDDLETAAEDDALETAGDETAVESTADEYAAQPAPDLEDEPELSADGGDGSDADAPADPAGASGGDDEPGDTADAPPLRTILEAVLFAAAEPVPINRLVKLLGAWPRAAVKEALDELGQALIDEGRGLRLAETAGGLQLRSAADCAPWVRRFFAEKPPRLSRAVLETLAIVAYRQPATRGEVEAVRGVNCDAVLSALLTRNLIQVAGRRQSPGRPVEYGTTEAFLELFSLKDLGELPDLPEPEALARLIEEAEAQQERTEDDDANPDGENPEDLEPGRDRVEEGGGGPDPGGQGPAEREGDLGARDEGGPEQG